MHLAQALPCPHEVSAQMLKLPSLLVGEVHRLCSCGSLEAFKVMTSLT